MTTPTNFPSNEIILFTFPESVFARRIQRYLTLRSIPFTQIRVPPNLPRPLLQSRLGINYRRIPLLALGRDIYIDSRLILHKLEQLFPVGKLGGKNAFESGLEEMLESFIIDGGWFWRTSGCIPVTAPLVQDEVWMKDRFDGSGGAFTRDALLQNRAWCISQLRIYFAMLEKMLGDGREWIFGSEGPGLVEIHVGWVVDWAVNMRGDMRDEEEGATADMDAVLSKTEFPRVHEWVRRFREIAGGGGEMEEGREAEDGVVKRVFGAEFTEPEKLAIEANDVLGLERGQRVSVAPTDFGFTHKDEGILVGLSRNEVVVEVEAPEGNGKLRLHLPRINFRIEKAG